MKLDTINTIKNIREKMALLQLPNSQQFENYSNIELVKVCRLFCVSPIYR
jgi:hypothetical protein